MFVYRVCCRGRGHPPLLGHMFVYRVCCRGEVTHRYWGTCLYTGCAAGARSPTATGAHVCIPGVLPVAFSPAGRWGSLLVTRQCRPGALVTRRPPEKEETKRPIPDLALLPCPNPATACSPFNASPRGGFGGFPVPLKTAGLRRGRAGAQPPSLPARWHGPNPWHGPYHPHTDPWHRQRATGPGSPPSAIARDMPTWQPSRSNLLL